MAAAQAVVQRFGGGLGLLLGLLMGSAFLTEVKLVAGISNNIGPFELLGSILIAIFFLGYSRGGIKISPSIALVFAIFAVAALSQALLPDTHRRYGLIQTSILLFLFLFLLTIYNMGLKFRLNPGYLLRSINLAVLVVGPWVAWHAVQFQNPAGDVGPFRNRAHMGTYMLTAFWLTLIYAFWPRLKRLERLAAVPAMGLCLYAVAISGRRSIYLSLFLGLAALALSFLPAAHGKRSKVALAAALSIGILALLYTAGSEIFPRSDFFHQRVGMLESRVTSALSAYTSERPEGPATFFDLQRIGVEMAFRTSPILGIGWGGFTGSEYSPTGHEVHSTPLRFLAETGLIGFTTYLALMGYLLLRSAWLFFRMRQTEWSGAYQLLAISLWSLMVSYVYNRHITERTFWLLFAVFVLMEALAEGKLSAPPGIPSREPAPRAPARGRLAPAWVPRPAIAAPADAATGPARGLGLSSRGSPGAR